MNLTIEKLRVLNAVQKMTAESEFNIAHIQKVMESLNKSRGAVAKLLTILRKEGYLDNPMRGCWRLTQKGAEELIAYQVKT